VELMTAPDSENNNENTHRVPLKQRAGGAIFILLSLFMGYITWLLNFEIGFATTDDRYLSIPFFALTITYFCGGFNILFGKESKWRLAIFVVNIILLILLTSFFLLVLVGYFTNPCYVDPMVCDDELTDTPMYLKMFGFLDAILALFTYTSWRLRQPTMPIEIEQ
jgi:hypothetical protein